MLLCNSCYSWWSFSSFCLSVFLHYLESMLSSIPFQEADAPTAAWTLDVNRPEDSRGCCGHRCGLLLFTRTQSHSRWVSCDRSHSYLIAESRRNFRRSQPLMSFRGNFYFNLDFFFSFTPDICNDDTTTVWTWNCFHGDSVCKSNLRRKMTIKSEI